MYLIDTHAHIYQPAFDLDEKEVIQRALDAGVQKILLPNIDLESVDRMHRLCDLYPTICYPMMGLHPCDVRENYRDVLQQLKMNWNHRKYCAVGEIGIDLYWDKSTLALQQEAFRIQIDWALEYDLPIVIHARESFDEIFAVLDDVGDKRLRGVFHCFTGNVNQAQKILSYETFWMGIGGVLTYDKAKLDQVITQIPIEKMVLETDSPYLSPKPHRGKRNESSYTSIVAQKMADILQLPLETIANKTTENANKLFGLS